MPEECENIYAPSFWEGGDTGKPELLPAPCWHEASCWRALAMKESLLLSTGRAVCSCLLTWDPDLPAGVALVQL